MLLLKLYLLCKAGTSTSLQAYLRAKGLHIPFQCFKPLRRLADKME